MEAFGTTPLFDGGYDGFKGFWAKVYGVNVCDSTKMCFVIFYMTACCVGLYAYHVVTTGSFMPPTSGTLMSKIVGDEGDPEKKTTWSKGGGGSGGSGGGKAKAPASTAEAVAAANAAEAKAKTAADAKSGIGGKKATSVIWNVKGRNKKEEEEEDDDEWVKME